MCFFVLGAFGSVTNRWDFRTANNYDVSNSSDISISQGLQITQPVSGNVWDTGSQQTVKWISTGISTNAKATLALSVDGGASFAYNIVTNYDLISATQYLWSIDSDILPSTNALLRFEITSSDNSDEVGLQMNSEIFTLRGIRVVRPIQNDMWVANHDNLIKYVSIGTAGIADLELVYNDNTTYAVLSGLTGPVDGSPTITNWTLPLEALNGADVVSNVILRITDAQGVKGESAAFKLSSYPEIEILQPAEGDFLKVGDTVEISWIKGGDMNTNDFQVFYSNDDFESMTRITGAVQYVETNNMFVLPWTIEENPGKWEIMVTNIVDAGVFDYSGKFDIVGYLKLLYPNGDFSDPRLHVSDRINASWLTEGSVSNVNLFYRSSGDEWIKLNPFPIANNHGSSMTQTVYQLDIPDVVTDSMEFRVQDANYLDVYADNYPGAYDDSDSSFSVVAAVTPRLAVTSRLIKQSVIEGQNAVKQSFGVKNSGTGSITYQASNNVTWIDSLSPLSGSSSGETNEIEITYQTDTLTSGSYTGLVSLSSSQASNTPVNVAVVVDVYDPALPRLEVSQDSFYLISPPRLDSVSKSFEIWNCCSGTLSYAVSGWEDWLSVSPSVGISTGEHDVITFECDSASLETGNHYGTIVVYSTNAENSPIYISVKLTVGSVELVFDNEDGPAVYNETGSFWDYSGAAGAYGSNSRYTIGSGASAYWTVDVPLSGVYYVEAWWPAYYRRSESVGYEVDDKYGSKVTYVDQRNTGNEWINLGLYAFDTKMGKGVRVTCPQNGQAGADAVRLVYFSDYDWDSDLDGFSDQEELLAGTSLINANDFFKISDVETQSGTNGIVISWDSLSGRLYSIYSHTNLLTAWPIDAIYQIEGTGNKQSYTNDANKVRFFRLGVEPSP